MVAIVSVLTRAAPHIGDRKRGVEGWPERWSVLWRMCCYAAVGDALVLWHVGSAPTATNSTCVVPLRPVLFICRSFAWELVFDFFHYWAHRLCHASPFLYRNVHKTHHRVAAPSPLTTYDHSPWDIVLSNTLPALVAFAVVDCVGLGSMDAMELNLLFAYKSYVEVAGHSGVDVKPRSFPQFVWLPGSIPCLAGDTDYSGIAIHTREHDWHHAVLRSNFSKRFRVWDVVFGTYEDPRQAKQ